MLYYETADLVAAADDMDDEDYTAMITDREAMDDLEPNDAQPLQAPKRQAGEDDPSELRFLNQAFTAIACP